VLAQDHFGLTLLISDNGSTDDTPTICSELAAADSRVVFHRQPANLGLTGNYNWLMQRALADQSPAHRFFMFLSDDDWIDPDYISTCIARLGAEPDHSMVAGRTLLEGRMAIPRLEDDVNLTSDSAAERLWAFCQEVLPTGVFSGVMPFHVVRRLPPQRNHLGHDWVLLANIAVLGKISTTQDTAIHRELDGASTSLRELTRTLGVPRVQAVRPLLTIGYFMVSECLRRSPVFGRLPIGRRLHLASVVLLALFSRRAVPVLERRRDLPVARVAVSGVHAVRRLVLGVELAPVARPLDDRWPTSDVESVRACPVCDSVASRPLHVGLTDQVFAIAGGRWDLQSCPACSAAFLDPRPAPHALGRAYGEGYYTHGAPLVPRPDLADGLSGLRLAGRNAYVNRRYGYELEPSSRLGLLLGYLRPRSRASDDRTFRHVARPHEGARLLDVGCGRGGFVARASALGWDAMGIDTDGAAVSACLASGLSVSAAPLEELAESMPGAFDVVTMAHVIEHVADPVSLLRAARAVLRPNGTLWLVTPSLDSRGHRRFGDRWLHLDPPRHLVLFSPEAIDRALREAGFESLDVPRSASGTIASFVGSWRIERGRSPLDGGPVPRRVRLHGQVAGVRSLFGSSGGEELIRLASPRPDG